MTDGYDILGAGSALADISVRSDLKEVERLGAAYGAMRLGEAWEIDEALLKIGDSPDMRAGGSCANSVAVAGRLGANCGFFGALAEDAPGRAFMESMKDSGVSVFASFSDAARFPTGRCLALVDRQTGERSMPTHIGAAARLRVEDVASKSLDSRFLVVESYLLDSEQGEETLRGFFKSAPKAEIVLSLSDPLCVDRHCERLSRIIDDCVDILIGNIGEFHALWSFQDERETLETAQAASLEACKTVIVTMAERGLRIFDRGVEIQIPPSKAAPLDSTGAGDACLGGLLWARAQGASWEIAGGVAAFLGARATEVIGAQLGEEAIKAAREMRVKAE